MQRRPRKPKQRMFALRNLAIPLAQGLALLVAVVLVYFATINLGLAEETVRSIAFATLMAGNLTLILVNRSWNLPLWQLKREHRNPKIYWILIGASLLLVSLLALEPLRNAFRMGALDLGQFLIAMGLGIISVLWFELIKAFRFRKLREPTAVPKRAAETARQEV